MFQDDEEGKMVESMTELLRIQAVIDMHKEGKVNKVLEMERCYDEKLRPLYANRNQFANSIPDLWPCLFSTHPDLRRLLIPDDLKIFEFLGSLELEEDFENLNHLGYSITFNFGTNPYFENTSLKKTFTFLDDGTTEITATPVQWKNRDVSSGIGNETKPNMTTALKGSFAKLNIRHKESFFKWFSCVEQKEMTESFEDKIADIIKENLWPNLLSFLLRTNPDVDEAYDEVTKTSEVENNQFDGLVHSFEKMLKIQDKIEKINEEARDIVLEVEKSHNETCKEVYRRRSEVLKTVPDFWQIAFLTHPVLIAFITAEDEEIFKHFTSLEVEDFHVANPGYSVTLHFEPNAYFENTSLTKTFRFLDEGTEITATPVKWKKGMVLNADKLKKQKKRFTSDISFFEWFSLVDPEQRMGGGNMDDHYEDVIAHIIKEDLWPSPLSYFNFEEPDGDKADQVLVRKNGKSSRFDQGPHGYLRY